MVKKISWSRTMHPKSPTLTLCATVLEETVERDILGVAFDI